MTLPTAAAAGQPSALDSRAPSAIELALAEYVCGPKTAATSDAGYLDCLSARVAALRADFGYDLTRLSAVRRKTIDKSCGRRLTAEGHDAYVACVNTELASMQEKRAPDSTTTPDPGAAGDPVATSAAVSPGRASSTWAFWLFGFLAVTVVAAGIPLAMRIKTAQHRCRNCGTNVPPTADLCPACRKQAAEAIRHAAAERIERERAYEEGGRRLEALTQQHLLPDEVSAPVQVEHQEPVQQPREEVARVQEEQPPQIVVAPQPEGNPAATGDELFDPYAVLGVSPDAGPEGIDAAYQQARSKYDPAAVDFLGEELQQYYKSKADAVDRAYRMLAGDVASSPPAAS